MSITVSRQLSIDYRIPLYRNPHRENDEEAHSGRTAQSLRVQAHQRKNEAVGANNEHLKGIRNS